jgi:hypothetical protein
MFSEFLLPAVCSSRVLRFIDMIVVLLCFQGNLEQTINCIREAQTLNQGSDFVKGSDYHFLNAGKTLN